MKNLVLSAILFFATVIATAQPLLLPGVLWMIPGMRYQKHLLLLGEPAMAHVLMQTTIFASMPV